MQAVASLMPAAQMLGRDELGRLPISHVFSWIWCAFKRRTAFAGQVLAAHFLWGRLPAYTHTQLGTLQFLWKCKGGKGYPSSIC